MKIKFLWWTSKVTWSKIYFEYKHKKFLLDYGMEQEWKTKLDIYKNNQHLEIVAKEIDYIILTHSHIDHSWLIPWLVKKWFRGQIVCEKINKNLLKALWKDCAYILEKDYEYLTTKKWICKKTIEPFYGNFEIRTALKHLKLVEYKKSFYPFENEEEVYFTFYDAGHILGAASVMFNFKEKNKKKNIYFSWDLWRKDPILLKPKEYLNNAENIVIESTYWNKNHNDLEKQIKDFWETISKTINRWWKVLIPSFALDRAQTLVYLIWKLKKNWLIKKDIPVYLDTPLGIRVLYVYQRENSYFRASVVEELNSMEDNLFNVAWLSLVEKTITSKMLTKDKTPSIIISASGMADHGRIINHINEQIENPKNTVILVWYSVNWSMGEKLEHWIKSITINWHRKKVNAEIKRVSLSSHADLDELLNFIKPNKKLKNVFIFHWEQSWKVNLKNEIHKKIWKKIEVTVANTNQYYQI